MQVGFLTAPFGGETLEYVVEFASKAGFDALEVAAGPGSKHIDTANLTDAEADRIRQLFADHKLSISSLAWYADAVKPDTREEQGKVFRQVVDAASKLGTDIVCTLAGMPVDGKDRFQTIAEDCKTAFSPLVKYAADKGIKVCLENWYATNIQSLPHFEAIFEAVPDESFGLNYDPSHLVHQEVDYLKAVDVFKDRIFHTHAKDIEIRYDQRAWIGVLNSGWWRYVVPGYGLINWGIYIARLKQAGYDGVLSIEHEDGALGREHGLEKGLAHLKQFA